MQRGCGGQGCSRQHFLTAKRPLRKRYPPGTGRDAEGGGRSEWQFSKSLGLVSTASKLTTRGRRLRRMRAVRLNSCGAGRQTPVAKASRRNGPSKEGSKASGGGVRSKIQKKARAWMSRTKRVGGALHQKMLSGKGGNSYTVATRSEITEMVKLTLPQRTGEEAGRGRLESFFVCPGACPFGNTDWKIPVPADPQEQVNIQGELRTPEKGGAVSNRTTSIKQFNLGFSLKNNFFRRRIIRRGEIG